MARESKYVKRITHREVSLFKNLARTGLTDRSQANTFHNINNNRLKKLENSKYIKRESFCVNGKNTEIIKLDKKGKSFCRNKLEIRSFATAQTNHLTHDLKVSLAYNSLTHEVKETWEHEREILSHIYKQYNFGYRDKLPTCIDARVQVDGEYIAIEVVGYSYSKDDIDLKESIALNWANCSAIEFIK